MLRLGQQVGRDPVGIGILVGDDQHLGRPGDHVDADLTEDPALGRGHVSVARPDDLGDGRDRRRAVGERGDGLRPADPEDLVDAREARGRQHEWIVSPRGVGTAMAIRGTPATFAGTAFITTEEG